MELYTVHQIKYEINALKKFCGFLALGDFGKNVYKLLKAIKFSLKGCVI